MVCSQCVTQETFDVVVIGGGPVGENAAARAVRGGLSVALVEHERYGGECSYWACMPSKALLRPGNALAAARRVPGVPVGDRLDPGPVFQRRDSFAAHWDDGEQERWVRETGIHPVRGHGSITGKGVVTVGDRVLGAEHAVVVCTGSVARLPELPGLADARVWTSREAASASTVPGRLAVLGGGVVGVEMAQAWARLGSRVELIIRGDRPLPAFPEFAGDAVAAGLRADGVTVHQGADATEVSRVDGEVRVGLADGRRVVADELLVATGRRPATDELGMETFGLRPGDRLDVDDSGLVHAVPGGWLYAAGDVTGRAPLTHQGKYAARVVGDVIAARAAGADVPAGPWTAYAATADHHAVPQVVFTDPEVAAVGVTGARRPEHREVEIDLAVAGSALHADGYTGRVRIVVDGERDVLVGATFVGQDVAEMVHAATVAIVGEVPLQRLWHAVPVFPSMNEVWLRLLEELGL
ncbi:NAD(P)/FAD-dependent oxidoreductase [Actinomadura sp. 7K507]|uniref:dihydrolipoyl dehydrogenase family protein n=1 Tax=Actinomadura sp. 7K507 TaxID=2530365 RepID=UPI003260F32F